MPPRRIAKRHPENRKIHYPIHYPTRSTLNPHFVESDPQHFKKLDSVLLCQKCQKQHPRHGLRSISLCGLPGIGKKTLAQEYSASRSTHFDFCLRVSAATIAQDFENICRILQLRRIPHFIDARVPENDRAKTLVKTWLHSPCQDASRMKFQKVRWLLIFEDVRDPKQLDGYWPGYGDGGIVLITTNPVFKDALWCTAPGIDVQPLVSWCGRELLIGLAQERNRRAGGSEDGNIARFLQSKIFCERVSVALGNIPAAIELMSRSGLAEWENTYRLFNDVQSAPFSSKAWIKSGV
ncbi:hypothetical protein K458DRAFT_392215 [Lentithecium fluviatile CBS 122367]|uniref:NB-ARC domain-containing protein n=1 Tax=Lentithecium fluviatile CBS 122367 TaxID=1168545 RepID=A0A6G1ISB3_9PLEO|nr:hypothetical protein K458DRAFT_392215 [Lentithecium fluviatile CBS 122367]